MLENDLNNQDLDPFGQKVWSIVVSCLDGQTRLTIKEVIDACEEDGLQASDSVIRERVAEFVDAGFLECLPGAGRRPSYYYLPEASNEEGDDAANLYQTPSYIPPDDADALKHLLIQEKTLVSDVSKLQNALSQKENELCTLQEDIQALKRVVKIKMRLAQGDENEKRGK